MHVYHVRGKIPFGEDVLDVDIEIPRSQILAMKKQLRGDGDVYGDYITYDKMLIVTSHFAAHLRLRMIPGTWLILLLLKACFISVRLGIIAVVILLIMRRWWWAIACLALTYIVNTYLQTLINYELGARLYVLDQHLGELYKKNESGNANRSGEPIERAIIIDAINVAEGMYEKYKSAAKAMKENGYSNEEAFWMCFALMSLQDFYEEEDAKVLGIENEIRLSEILEKQLSIYCEEVNREMKSEEVGTFLNLLKDKFDEIRNVVFESNPDDYSQVARDLCRVLYRLSGETNIQHAVAGTQYVLKMMYELSKDGPVSLMLIRDV